MYITKKYNGNNVDFDWDTFFSSKDVKDAFTNVDKDEILHDIRKNFQENQYLMTLVLCRVVDEIFHNTAFECPRILELGAATGFLTRLLVDRYNGTGVLVDKNITAYKRFLAHSKYYSDKIEYLNIDIFQLGITEKFNLVCSFGLIEHFQNKSEIIYSHKKFLKADGHLLILVPLDSVLTRVFFSIHPELNLGYRELLSEIELKEILKNEGLDVIKTSVSTGYCYDFIAALCKLTPALPDGHKSFAFCT
ncbi:MAG: class I SAM-dependent methyltransferase [Gammaproteobacteria bacterium]|nr:class I SAM-dependent methyltransferase [Gammaproteobacteria bacterium]